MATTMERLEAVFRQALELPAGRGVKGLTYQTETWDSVAHLKLVSAIELEFGVMFETDDILGMSSFEKGAEVLRKQGVEI